MIHSGPTVDDSLLCEEIFELSNGGSLLLTTSRWAEDFSGITAAARLLRRFAFLSISSWIWLRSSRISWDSAT